MHHEALSTYLSGKEFYNNSNAIYETLEQDPLNLYEVFQAT